MSSFIETFSEPHRTQAADKSNLRASDPFTNATPKLDFIREQRKHLQLLRVQDRLLAQHGFSFRQIKQVVIMLGHSGTDAPNEMN